MKKILRQLKDKKVEGQNDVLAYFTKLSSENELLMKEYYNECVEKPFDELMKEDVKSICSYLASFLDNPHFNDRVVETIFSFGDLEMVKIITQNKLRGFFSFTDVAFAEACMTGNAELVKYLLANVYVEVISESIDRALAWAAYEGNREIVDALLQRNFSRLDTAFVFACANFRLDLAKLFLSHKVNVYSVDQQGQNALHLVSMKLVDTPEMKEKQLEMLKFLLQKGTWVDELDEILTKLQNRNVDSSQRQEHHQLIIQLLSEKRDDNLSDAKSLVLIDYVKKGLYSSVRQIMSNMKVLKSDKNGISALEHAARFSDSQISLVLCQIISSYKNLITVQDMERATVWACRMGNVKLTQHLYEIYNDPINFLHIRDPYNNTLLSIACFFGKEEIVEFLLEKGATPTHEDFYRAVMESKNKRILDLLYNQLKKEK